MKIDSKKLVLSQNKVDLWYVYFCSKMYFSNGKWRRGLQKDNGTNLSDQIVNFWTMGN